MVVDVTLTICKGYWAMDTSAPTIINVDAVAFQDSTGAWIGQCIQYDISAHAKSLPGLTKAIERQIAANVCVNEKLGRKLLDGIPPAPDHFAEAFQSGEIGLSPTHKLKSLDSFTCIHLHDLRVVETA
jgi:hypothetical protein